MANFDMYTGQITSAVSFLQFDAQIQTGIYVNLYGATHAGVSVVWEGTPDGGTTWESLMAYRIDQSLSNPLASGTGVITSNSNQQWYVMCGAVQSVRIRATAWTSGTLNMSCMPVDDADPVLTGGLGTTGTAATALADGVTNPTVGSQGVLDYWFNGTTWDRVRNNVTNIALDASSARTATGNGLTAVNYNHAGAFIFINVTAASGTTPTAVFRVQFSVDNGTTWIDLDTTNAVTASLTTTGTAVIKVYPGIPVVAAGSCNSPLPRTWRLAWTIGGTTPSFTFATTVAYIL
jgi:hypothetical protein